MNELGAEWAVSYRKHLIILKKILNKSNDGCRNSITLLMDAFMENVDLVLSSLDMASLDLELTLCVFFYGDISACGISW